MSAEISIHDVIGVTLKGPRKLPGRTAWVVDLLIYERENDTRTVRPHVITLFASRPDALVPMRAGEVEHVG